MKFLKCDTIVARLLEQSIHYAKSNEACSIWDDMNMYASFSKKEKEFFFAQLFSKNILIYRDFFCIYKYMYSMKILFSLSLVLTYLRNEYENNRK